MPSKTLLRPGEALADARRAPGAREAVTGDLDVARRSRWRDYMVSDYDDANAGAWLKEQGIDLLRGTGRIAGPGTVAVGDDVHTTEHIVIATGSDPVIPPIDGLRELDGVWTNREATGLKEVPERLLVLGGGPVGVEMAQAIARMGSSVALVEGADRVLSKEPPALGEMLQQGARSRRDRVPLRPVRDGRRAATATATSSSFQTGRCCAATSCWWRPAAGRASRASASRRSASSREGRGPGRRPHGRRRQRVGDRRRDGNLAADLRRQVPGPDRGREHPRARRAEANYEAVPRVIFTDPQAASVGEAEGP